MDVVLSLGWSIKVGLGLDEIEQIKEVASRASGIGDTISDVCVVPGTDRNHSFICVRIRRRLVQADRENIPLHLVGNNKRKRRGTRTRKNGKMELAGAAAAAEPSLKKARTDRAASANGKKQQKE